MNAREVYNRTADMYNQKHDSPATRHLRKREQALMERYVGGRVLDVGCGTGYWLGPNTVGIDISERMLRLSRGKAPLVQASGENLPFRDGIFDTVTCMFSVLNLMNPVLFAKEASRVLRPGGTLVMSLASTKERGKFRIAGTKLRLNLLSRKEVEDIFRKAGFIPEHFDGLFVFERPVWGLWKPFPLSGRIKLALERVFGRKENGRMYLYAFRKQITPY